jgi:hypothetical protein
MPEDYDYTPAPWSAGDSFASARATYDVHVRRSYNDAVDKGLKASDLLPARITTDVRAPLGIVCDETGSMGDSPATIFAKYPFLAHEVEYYLGPSWAMMLGAFGDINHDSCEPPEKYPVQMRPFAKDKEVADRLKELVIEKRGGGQTCESAELTALYIDRNVEIPNAVRPILIFITNEHAYSQITTEDAKRWCKVELEKTISTKEVFESLKAKWAVYVIRLPYGHCSEDNEDSTNRSIREFWEKLVGDDHVAFLPDAARIVDVILGIFAREAGMIDEFEKELKDRQLKDVGGEMKVLTATKALKTIHRDHHANAGNSVKKLPDGDKSKSITHRGDGSKSQRSKSLLD